MFGVQGLEIWGCGGLLPGSWGVGLEGLEGICEIPWSIQGSKRTSYKMPYPSRALGT